MGIFVVFDGIDGCGKTTQLKKFVDYIFQRNKYNNIIVTREPYKETDARKILYEGRDSSSQSEKLADLFINDRKRHAEDLIMPSLNKGWYVVCDRYKLSTI